MNPSRPTGSPVGLRRPCASSCNSMPIDDPAMNAIPRNGASQAHGTQPCRDSAKISVGFMTVSWPTALPPV
jgi:hypothetical protein